MAFNVALKLAFVEARTSQIAVAATTEIHESRLSKIINGHIEPTDDEKQKIAAALGKAIGQLFPEAIAS